VPGAFVPREISGAVSAAIREKVAALARDPSPDVQLQVAIASRKIKDVDALPVLSDCARPLRARQNHSLDRVE